MKLRHLFCIGVFLALSACGGQQTLVEQMTIHGLDAGKTISVIHATERVMIRRLAAMDVKGATATAIPTGTDTALLTIQVPDSAALDRAKAILANPFTFDLRIEQPKTGTGETETINWTATTLTGSSLEWVQAVGSNRTGAISIELQFTKQGHEQLAAVFHDNVGQNLGIFVRDVLVSKMSIKSAESSDRIVILGIPSAKVAEIFADDVNVGLRVTFTPVP